jgi:GNAT superfamily N-acetyltransferase
MIEICQENPNSLQSRELLNALAMSLTKIAGDSAKEHFEVGEFLSEKAVFIVARRNGVAIACGGFRYLQPGVCEMKRIYSRQAGVGKLIVTELEKRALVLGYQQIKLATRKANTQAIRFYTKQGYQVISPFGPYTEHSHYLSLAKPCQSLAIAHKKSAA